MSGGDIQSTAGALSDQEEYGMIKYKDCRIKKEVYGTVNREELLKDGQAMPILVLP